MFAFGAVDAAAASEWTVYFIDGSAAYTAMPTQTVADGGKITEPTPPPVNAAQGRVSFRGWSIDDPSDGAPRADSHTCANGQPPSSGYCREDFWGFSNQVVTADVTLYAVFSNKVLISYRSGEYFGNNVFCTQEIEPGTTFDVPQRCWAAMDTPPGMRFQHWYKDGDSPSKIYYLDSAQPQADVFLVPYFSENINVVFDSQGGSSVDTQAIEPGGKAKKPADPVRPGYTFLYWTTQPGNQNPFDFASTPITNELTLYAVWQGEPVGYTIVLWLEKAESDDNGARKASNYAFSRSYTVPAPTSQADCGTGLSLCAGDTFPSDSSGNWNAVLSAVTSAASASSPLEWIYSNNQSWAQYAWSQSDPLRSDGTSIVNLYYDRKDYTITFSLGAGTIRDTTQDPAHVYTESEYTITARVGQSIADVFPTLTNPKATWAGLDNNKPYQFNVSGLVENTAWISLRPMLTANILPTNGATNYTVIAEYFTSGQQPTYFHYMLQDTNSTACDKSSPEYYQGSCYIDQTADNVAEPYSQVVYWSITGVSDVNKSQSNIDAFHKPIAGMIAGLNLAAGVGGNSTWSYFQTVYPNAPSLDNPYHLYLYYKAETYTLSFDLQGGKPGTGTGTALPAWNVPYLRSLELYEPATPTREGYTFVGWYDTADCARESAVGCEKFNFKSAMPAHNVTLFAKWQNSQTFEVEFYRSVRDTTEVDSQTVPYGSYASAPSDYVVNQSYYDGEGNALGQFKGWVTKIAGTTYTVDFKFTTPITKNTKVYGLWKTSGFKISYDPVGVAASSGKCAGGGWKNSSDPQVDEKAYDFGTQARVADGSKTQPETLPGGERCVFYGWESVEQVEGREATGVLSYPFNFHTMTGDTTLRAVYGKLSSSVSITFHPLTDGLTGANTGQVVWYTAAYSEMTLPGASFYLHPAKEVVAWAETEDCAKAATVSGGTVSGPSECKYL
ncbi:MAG: InlB B-repeat-containing protein, partial [Propionibacteriaceae bacterium]|nr:InlB B-repeat-containing protein [Propionibacteriaceae bacterium]